MAEANLPSIDVPEACSHRAFGKRLMRTIRKDAEQVQCTFEPIAQVAAHVAVHVANWFYSFLGNRTKFTAALETNETVGLVSSRFRGLKLRDCWLCRLIIARGFQGWK